MSKPCPCCEGRRIVLFVSKSDPLIRKYAACSRCGGLGVVGRDFTFRQQRNLPRLGVSYTARGATS